MVSIFKTKTEMRAEMWSLLIVLPILMFTPIETFAQMASGETLNLNPPQGWVPAFHDTQGNVELVELVPQGQTMHDWSEMLMIQLIGGKPTKTPEEVLSLQQVQIHDACDDSGFGPISTSKENGYDTATQVMACTKSKKYNKGELSLFKVIRGRERLYIVDRVWRGSPFDKEHQPLPPETTSAWLDFMQQAILCDTPTPCHATASVSQPPQPRSAVPPAQRTSVPEQTSTVQFATRPLVLTFPRSPPHPDDIAVIIGNADYSKGHDIPDAKTAYADAESMRRYALDGLGIPEGNVIFLKDATGSQLTEVFGNERDYRGKLFNWVKAGKSRVFVYYIGHGAPGDAKGRAMLVPSDASASQIALSGYPLDLLYDNLGKVPAENITVVLDACFSGASPAGSVMGKALPIGIVPKAAPIPANLTVISAAAADQMANWEQDDSHALFTEYFLKGMSGEANKPPYGNGDGKVTLDQLDRYLQGTLSYWARRYYGRDQTAQIVKRGQ